MISFLIPWNSGDSYREQSFEYLFNFLLKEFPESEICVGEDDSEVFNRSKARNNAFEISTNNIICIIDADTIIPPESVFDGINICTKNSTWVIPYYNYFNLTREYSQRFMMSDSLPLEDELEFDFKILSWAGALILDREMYHKVGGYDERFEGWGWEDVAFRVALDNKIGRHLRCGSYVAHLWHPRNDADFGTEDELKNRKLFDKEYRKKYGWRDERV